MPYLLKTIGIVGVFEDLEPLKAAKSIQNCETDVSTDSNSACMDEKLGENLGKQMMKNKTLNNITYRMLVLIRKTDNIYAFAVTCL